MNLYFYVIVGLAYLLAYVRTFCIYFINIKTVRIKFDEKELTKLARERNGRKVYNVIRG